jgi:subtilisin family serine protease
VVDDPADVAPHVSVGALNPNRTSTALYSNVGSWVKTYAPGSAVLSTSPPFDGGIQAGSRNDRYGRRRETIDPDDFTGGFAIWSGTSFAAPHVAATLARAVQAGLLDGSTVDKTKRRIAQLRRAAED